VFRHIAFPLAAFDYLKDFQRGYEAMYGQSITNNQALAIILAEHQRGIVSNIAERGIRKDDDQTRSH
jgi:hypothetical protein